ncbi:Regulator of G-protein signaling 19, partial [Thoreauomyces humboldtii]
MSSSKPPDAGERRLSIGAAFSAGAGRRRSTSFGQKLMQRTFGQPNSGEPSSTSGPSSRRTSLSQVVSNFSGPSSPRAQRNRESTAEKRTSLATSDDPESVDRRQRIARVMSKQQQRISVHIQQFSKITVTVSGTDVTLNVTISRTDTVEQLAKLIEAEYAYMFFMNEDDSPTVSRLPLVIGQVYDGGVLALKFDDRVGDVLGFTDKISVINAFEGESVNRVHAARRESEETLFRGAVDGAAAAANSQPPPIALEVRAEESLSASIAAVSQDFDKGSDEDVSTKPVHTARSDKSVPKIQGAALDDRLQACLRNKLALRFFSESCAEEYTIENLLFWLDVEVFQSLPPQHREMYGKYLYLTYVSVAAPLQVNIPAEIRNDIPWPLNDSIDETLFDEAQEQVYAMIKGHSFIRFERSPRHKLYMDAREKGKSKACRECFRIIPANHPEEFQQSRMAGPFAYHFQSNIETARAVIPMLEKTVTQEAAALLIAAAKNGTSTRVATIKFRESMLSRTVVQYFPLANRIMEGYFNEHNRSSWGNKQKRMHKEKKLAKFFGERPSVELIQRQIAAASASYLRGHRENSHESLVGTTTDGLHEADEDSDGDPSSQSQRRKKKDKLEEFFGDRLPTQQRKVQQLMLPGEAQSLSLANSDESETGFGNVDSAESLPMETTNELDPEERRILQRRTKKITSMLGESLDEKTISKQVTSAAMHDRIGGTILIEEDSSAAGVAGSTGNRRPSLVPRKSETVSRSIGKAATDNPYSDSDEDGDSKLSHKRRLDKISSLMGQRIGVSELQVAQAHVSMQQPVVPSRPLTVEEKKVFHKKSSKLERMLGELPPVEAIMASLPGDQKPEVMRVRKSLVGLAFLVKHAKDVVDIMDALTEISDEKLDKEATDLNLLGASQESLVAPAQDKENRQKKLKKLRKFFGNNVSVEMLIETQILADLERSLMDVAVDEEQLNELRAEVASIREEVRRRSDEFRQDLSNPSTSSDNTDDMPNYIPTMSTSRSSTSSSQNTASVPRMSEASGLHGSRRFSSQPTTDRTVNEGST